MAGTRAEPLFTVVLRSSGRWRWRLPDPGCERAATALLVEAAMSGSGHFREYTL